MAEWGSFHLTKQGESLLADAHNQKQLMLTRIVLGSGELADGQSVRTLTELVNQEQSFPIRSITNNNDGTFTIEARVTNNSLTAGYRVKECGVMAETYSYDDEGNTITTSVLFGTAQATESDFMPAPTGATMVDAPMRITIVIDSDVNVTAKIDYDAYATIKYSDAQDEEWYEKAKALIQKVASSLDILPIGTILAFGGSLSDIPDGWHICNGKDGTPDLTGRFLEGVAEASAKGTFKDAGLPNIKGIFGNTEEQSSQFSGVFKAIGTRGGAAPNGYSGGGYNVSMDASRASSVYGNSETVQPSSYTVYYIIKQKKVTIEI